MQNKDIVIAIDEGTTNCKAIALDSSGKVLAKASRPLEIKTPNPGWVEQDAEFLVQKTLEVVAETLKEVDPARVGCIGISNQRETAVGWYRDSGRPFNAAITWQCSRTAEFCEALREKQLESVIKRTTGLPVATLFAGSKMRWLLDSLEGGRELAQKGAVCLGTVDAWLLWNLTGGKAFRCDYSNASRTQCFNLATLNWDKQMLEIFGIPAAALPEICPSSYNFGVTANLKGIPDGIPIMSMAGDSHLALYGHGLGERGCVKTTYGTGSSVMAPLDTPDTSVAALATTVAWHDGNKVTYGIEGNINHTGDALKWMCEVTRMGKLEDANAYINQIADKAPDNLGIYFVPMLTGAGAPWWQEQARGIITGLTRGATTAHLIRAALECITYQIADVIDFMHKIPGFKLNTLMVDGGPTKNDWLMQFQADLLGCKVARSGTSELSAIGAAMLALKCKDNLSTDQLRHLIPEHFVFTPNPERTKEYARCRKEWTEAVKIALNTHHGS